MAIIIIALVVAAAGVGYLIYYGISRASRNAAYDDIKPKQIEAKDNGSDYTPPVDFRKLQEINADIYAYIDITGTDVQYPIVQGGPHEDYYLDHTIEHTEGLPGSIYTQLRNAKDFSDFNTVIYGHDLSDGTMFTALHNYRDIDFFNGHREIKIYMPEKEITYKVFAAITYDDRLIPAHYDFTVDYAREQFISSIYNNRYMSDVIADDVKVTKDDNIITLSTCIWELPEKRFLVLAVKTGEKP